MSPSHCVQAHGDSEDPPGEPYIVHPMRVVVSISKTDDAHQDELLRCVGLLHDVLERTEVTAKDLRTAGMPQPVIRAVELLTHENEMSDADDVIRLKSNRLARMVKIADLMDNAALRHVTFRANKLKDGKRVIRYAASYKYLTNQMNEKAYRRIMRNAE